MNRIFARSTGLARLGCALGLVTLLSACGAPRVHEVYRPTAFSEDRSLHELSDSQRELRRLSLQAIRTQHRSNDIAGDAAQFAMVSPGNLHDCAPGLMAQLTGTSAFMLNNNFVPDYSSNLQLVLLAGHSDL